MRVHDYRAKNLVLRRYLRRCHRALGKGGFPFDKARDTRVMLLLLRRRT